MFTSRHEDCNSHTTRVSLAIRFYLHHGKKRHYVLLRSDATESKSTNDVDVDVCSGLEPL